MAFLNTFFLFYSFGPHAKKVAHHCSRTFDRGDPWISFLLRPLLNPSFVVIIALEVIICVLNFYIYLMMGIRVNVQRVDFFQNVFEVMS